MGQQNQIELVGRNRKESIIFEIEIDNSTAIDSVREQPVHGFKQQKGLACSSDAGQADDFSRIQWDLEISFKTMGQGTFSPLNKKVF